jgi:hypothetical protein
MHLFGSEWRLVVAGLVLCVIISFVRSVMGRRPAALFDVVLAILTIGVLVYVLR